MSLLIKNIGLLATPTGTQPKAGAGQGKITLVRDAALFMDDGTVSYAGPQSGLPACEGAEAIDARGALVTPGFVDAHTHLVFGGWRQHEASLKLAGVSYLDILKQGGGILDTVRATRAASQEELTEKGLAILDDMLSQGTTTCEAKSGYGLDCENELKQLRVIKALGERHPMTVVPTFLGAHAFPPEYAGDHEGFVKLICDEMIPRVCEEGLARFCDVFCDLGVFDAAQSERILKKAQAYGLRSKVHADEIGVIGGSEMAAAVGAVSAEHLIESDTPQIAAMAKAGVIAVLLPSTSFYLGKTFARAREMVEAGVPVSVASDFNPGSCPSRSLQLAANLAFLKYRLTPAEVLTAVTLNAACAIGLGGEVGTLEPGKRADAVIWDAPDLEMICYRFGSNQARTVIKDGRVAIHNRR